MLGQLAVSHPYEVLVKFYCNKFWLASSLQRPKAKTLCRKRHDLAFNKGCGRLHCGLCTESKSTHGSSRRHFEGQELFSRRLVYCSSLSSDGLQADIQEVRGEDAVKLPPPFQPRCVQGTGTGQASLSCQPLDLWTLWQVFLPRSIPWHAYEQGSSSNGVQGNDKGHKGQKTKSSYLSQKGNVRASRKVTQIKSLFLLRCITIW